MASCRNDLDMTLYESIKSRLSGRTGMPEEIEEELIRRIAVIEEEGGVCENLPKSDWIATCLIAAIFGILPVVLVAIGIL